MKLFERILVTLYRLFVRYNFQEDYHIHSILSDGELWPDEIAEHYKDFPYMITDHVNWNKRTKMVKRILSSVPKGHRGAEIHTSGADPSRLDKLALYLKERGIERVLVHSFNKETDDWIAHESKHIDVWAHPGEITEIQAIACSRKFIKLEITANPKHSRWNRHIKRLAERYGIGLSYGTDTHISSQLLHQ